ncbi:MAG: YbdD/YjiX family protein [Gemmatimonadaceae bacterium]
MTQLLATACSRIARGLRAMLGAPDYERYLAHMANHPGTPLSRELFERERLQARYNRPGSRCC